ncbi:MAG: hypothetical protein U0Q16_04415 [Bryobacteraceae bacterium]
MPVKDNFTEGEWSLLRDAPNYVALAVSMAGASGVFGTLGEVMAAGKAVYEATSHSSELIRALAAKDEVQASQEALRSAARDLEGAQLPEWVRTSALGKARQAVAILVSKSADDAAAYREWLQSLGVKVAEASKEGGFLGFGGERVSEGEKKFLDELKSALA